MSDMTFEEAIGKISGWLNKSASGQPEFFAKKLFAIRDALEAELERQYTAREKIERWSNIDTAVVEQNQPWPRRDNAARRLICWNTVLDFFPKRPKPESLSDRLDAAVKDVDDKWKALAVVLGELVAALPEPARTARKEALRRIVEDAHR
jgi:hypothetical protein